MRWMVAVCLASAACGGANSGQVTTLEHRVAVLEAKPAPVPPRDSALEARVRDLEAKVAELEAQVARGAVAKPSPAPPPPPRRGGLDDRLVYHVPLDDSPAIGPADAAVTLVAAVQFPEPYTHKAWPVLKDLRALYKKDLRIVFKSFIVHPQATKSSIAACAAARQSSLDKMEAAIYTAATDQGGIRELDDAELHELARALRLNLKQYARDIPSCRLGQTRDIAMFKQLGQAAVPVFWINGRPLSGAQPIENFKKMIDEELAKAKHDRAAGGRAADYYERTIANGITGP